MYDPEHTAEGLLQNIIKSNMKVNGVWADSRHTDDDKIVETDQRHTWCADTTVSKVRQTGPRNGFEAWQALVDSYALK